MLRKISGPIKDQNGWRIRTNDELQVTHRKPNIVTRIKSQKTRMGCSPGENV
jgi:hypothetical protein